MPVTVTEKFESRVGGDDQIDLVYVITGTDDDAAARSALASTAPATFNGLYRQTPTIEPIGPELWEGKARYIPANFTAPATGDAAFSFDTTGGSQHITQSRQTIASYAATGTPPNFGGAIGVTHDNVEGIDIQMPVFSFAVTRYIAPASMSSTYVGHLYTLTGKVNSATFTVSIDGIVMSFQAGECLFLGATGGKRGAGDWEINFRFAGSPNATGIVVGAISGIAKKGWEYMWVRYADAEDSDAIIKKPVAVYIEQVYDTGNFSLLNP